MEDEDKKYCKICLVTDCKMFNSPSISEAYSQLVEVVLCDNYKLYVCYECKHLLNKCQEFRLKCIMALNVLSSIHTDHSKITKRIIRDIDRKHYKLESKLSHGTMHVCNSNEPLVLPELCLDSCIKFDIDIKPDVSEDDNYDFENINSRDPLSDVQILPDMETMPDIKTLLAVETIPDVEILPNVGTKPDVESLPNIDTIPNVETLPNVGTKPDIETLSDVKTMPSVESLSDMETLPDMETMPGIKTLSDVDTMPLIETQDTDYLNKNIQLNNEQKNIVPERKSKQKCSPKSKKTKENVPKKKKPLIRRKPSKYIEMIHDYTIIDVMTPSEAKEEMLLRKESRNYKTSPHKCDLCYRGFTMESTYNNHVVKSHNRVIGPVECEFCHCLFRIISDLTSHIEACHKYKIMCKFCPYVCRSPTQANNHIAIHKGETYTCEQCAMTFRYSNTLANHKRIKHSECVCAHCGSMFVSLAGLKVHKHREHKLDSTELLGPKCEECDIQFATETAWKRHLVLSTKHTVSNGCEECGESFSSAGELRRHAKMHPKRETPTRYVCKPCDKFLESYAEYKEHMMTNHPNSAERRLKKVKRQVWREKKYVCEVCGRAFKSYLHLQYHINKHTGRRPYECDQCDKKYSQPAALYQHKFSHHSGAPKPKCDICQKRFHNKNALRKHISTVHLGVRRFKCDICNKSFRHQCEVKTHMEYVHFKKPWPKRDRTKRRNKEDKLDVEYLDLSIFDTEEC